MAAAATSKREHYKALKAVIHDHLSKMPGRIPDVLIIPLVIGARGGIQEDWHDTMAQLVPSAQGSSKLAKQLSELMLEESRMIYSMWTNHYNMVIATTH